MWGEVRLDSDRELVVQGEGVCAERAGEGEGMRLDYGTASRNGTQFSLSRPELHWQRLTVTFCTPYAR